MNPVLPRGRTDDEDRVTRPFSDGRDHVVALHKPYRHGIDQRIGFVRWVKDHLAARHGYAERVAIVANTAHHAVE